ncbi:MAG: LptF/LptG family permease [Vulcanimicrobiaceae bacterium]
MARSAVLLRAGATAEAILHPTILDRYLVAELAGPFAFGLSAFTLIFAATDLLAISRLVSEEHAPLGAAIEYFLWQLPWIVVQVLPMAMLLGTLLAMQRLSSDSELNALKAGGVGLVRAVAPLLVVGVLVSLVSLVLQEGVVPIANGQAAVIKDRAIRAGPFSGGSRTVVTPLPGGGQQVTFFRGYDAASQSLLGVTIVTYAANGIPSVIVFSKQARYDAPSWTLVDASEYAFQADGTTTLKQDPLVRIDIGERPSEIALRTQDVDRESLSLVQLKTIIDSGQLSPQELRAYQTTFEEKFARPFAAFVFTLFAVPFGLRPTRGGGAELGFGLAVAIAFVYFVIASVSLAVATGSPGGYIVSALGAWLPNVLFTAIGAALLARAARY